MGKNINIDSTQWRDVVFADRNKAYGAYHLRATSGKRHVVAFFIVVLMVMGVMALPFIVDFVEQLAPKETVGPMEESFELSHVEAPPKEEKVPEENILKQVAEPPPPPKLKTTVRFTVPEVVDDDEVDEDETMRSQDELQDLTGTISTTDVTGSDDADAVDIADIANQQIIEQAPVVEVDKPIDIAEVMPDFPGGDLARVKFLKDNMNYPSMAKENGIQGTVVIGFVVTASGSLENIRVIRGRDRLLDEEALRVVRKMPPWVPGKQGGRSVAVNVTLPIKFELTM